MFQVSYNKHLHPTAGFLSELPRPTYLDGQHREGGLIATFETPSTALVKNLRSASILYLGKPSTCLYRTVCAIGFTTTPSSPVVVKIARDEMVEITSVSNEIGTTGSWTAAVLQGS